MYIVIISLLVVVLFLSYVLGKKFHFFRQLLILLYVVLTSVYIIWRIGWTLPYNNWTSFLFGIFLLAAEIGGFVLSLVFYRIFLKKYQRSKLGLESFQGKYPSVDIFIATYNESTDILKRGIVAAKLSKYPITDHVNIYVCDDGNRPDVLSLCQELEVHYVSRTTHEHAKAGNLNHALTVSDGELIVTMDADMVMREDFLEKTIGYFSHSKMGFIQTPQTFFNQDPYQFNLFAGSKIGNDQDFFMRRIETQKDAFNAVMYVGSNAVFRRQALESINGFTTGVITEDMATGMFLQSQGWESGFVNENLASGLAPETFGDLVKQRDRWARGNIQVAKKWNPWRIKGLTLTQRILYVDGIHYWFSGIYKMIFLLAPLLFLIFGQYSLQTNLNQILIFWLPSFLSSQLAFNLVAEKKQTVTLSNIYEVATAPFMAFAVFNELFLKSKKGFAVTRKGVNNATSYYNFSTAWPILLLLGLSVVALIRGVAFVTGYWESPFPIEGIYINVFWLSYNVIGLIFAAYLSNERPRLRQSERFNSKEDVQILLPENQSINGHIVDWNEDGARIRVKENAMKLIQKNSNLEGKLIILGVEFEFISKWQIDNIGHHTMGVIFKDLSSEAYELVIAQTYAQSSENFKENKYKNRVWHIILLWWINTLKKRKTFQNNK
ncbi:Cellulose synthase catalytic subunit [UDP-forming] [Leuconostoc gelidum subsp. gasicomitatum]|uniref:Cellulose synthase catalytic subunit [UDP-forming] n=1 Tax=Leuconostoc gasicomitatum TaxID=115778 RepID=A0A9Q3XT65_9LACO|nr:MULTISPECIES: glycosyltransferase family 2 protein [Leuconostoc gelidum group]MBZ5962609.1 glycosyltransferase [Leuconostoc gasicomitatum]MBZ5977393.1 glycosyltransferase [Leuconostoc gelidum subsp. gelidum]CUW17667.1 Cellulose synthase catalytic subunit [UDP-forming] [Leuconostoc gasicomitatum]